ncbi:MAG: hypothetical protein COA99_17495 [Moraxellaceae bacterium]|nr:MAG: hypothetical protein COA99_17495 [Moraxellaceae bacterium]
MAVIGWRALVGVLVLLGIISGVLVTTIWPFIAYPVMQLHFTKVTPKVAQDVPQMMAGIAVRDITTPIGIPKFGYATWAREADGFRNKLKARLFYIKPKLGEPVAIVQADLPVSSLILHQRIAELIASKTDIASHNLSLHVTHTHSGPGHFLSNDFYNAFGTNKPGFDPDVFEFLALRIADGLIEAYKKRRPAKIAVGVKRVYGAAKNRSIGAYVANNNVSDKSETDAAAEQAVNPVMTMVRVDLQKDDGSYVPAGAFTSFSIHGTGIAAFTRPYHGDVWTYFERELEWFVDGQYSLPWSMIHGPFEATHGDNRPNIRPGLRGDLETRRIGMLLGGAAITLFQSLDGTLKDDVTIISAMRVLDVLALDENAASDLCPRALVGAALVAGAKGEEVFPISYIPPFKAGFPAAAQSGECHGEKNIMLSGLQAWGLGPERFPHMLSISGFQIDNLLMIGVPFEVTFESGNRIRAAISHALSAIESSEPHAAPHIVVASHTNGYFGYSTTREEYAQQWYEGGHAIYGPGTSAFLAKESARLAADMIRQPGFSDMPAEWTLSLSTRGYFPEQMAATGEQKEWTAPEYNEAGVNQEAYWAMTFLGVNPSEIVVHEPLLSVQWRLDASHAWSALSINGVEVNDAGYDMQLRYLDDKEKGMSRYEVRWFNPGLAGSKGLFRFMVQGRAGLPPFYSSSFSQNR